MENKQFLGWGLLGTPKGRQQTSDGIDKQLNFAKHFDLDQLYGGCLPDPRQDSQHSNVLYCVIQRKINNSEVLGIAEYRSIFEQGQTRAGTYFGSFVEVVNANFSPEKVNELLSTLVKLSSYQLEQFIDQKTLSYHTSITGKTFPAPQEQLNIIAEHLQKLPVNYLMHTKQQGDLYIQCDNGQLLAVLKVLLISGISRQFEHIFFSESEHIANQMREKRIEFKTASQLLAEPFFTQPYQQEIATLHQHIKQVQSHQQQAIEEKNRLEAHQANLVAEQVKQQAEAYVAERDRYKAQAEQAQRQAQASGVLAQLGKQVFDYAAQNADKLGKVELAQFAPRDNGNNEINSRIAGLTMSVEQLNRKLTEAMQPAEEPERSSNVITWILGAISAVLFAILMGILIMGAFSDDKTIPKKDYDSLKKEEAKAKDLEKQLKEAQDKLQTQKFSQEDMNKRLNEFTKQFCSQLKKDNIPECKDHQK